MDSADIRDVSRPMPGAYPASAVRMTYDCSFANGSEDFEAAADARRQLRGSAST